jgi:hypothetical protein
MTTHFPGLSKSVVLTHKYMTTHFPGLSKSVVLTHKYMTTHFPGLSKSVALTHKYMTTHFPGLSKSIVVRTTDLLRPGKWVVMYLCVRATDFASTLLMFDFGIVSTVCYFCFSFYHFISSPDLKVMWAIAITWRPSSLSIVRRKLFQKSSPLKVLDQWKPNLVRIITRVSSFKIVSGDAIHQPTWPLFLKIEQTLYGKIAGFG